MAKQSLLDYTTHDILSLSESQKESFNTQHVFEIFPEYYVLKVNAFNDIAKDTLDEWIYYLKNNQVKDGFKAKGLHEVKEKLRVDSLSDVEREAYFRHVENDRLALSLLHTAKMEGEAKGLADGERNKASKIALKMIARGESDEAIAELTELSLEEVRLLRKQQEK